MSKSNPIYVEETKPFIRINRNPAAVLVAIYFLFLYYRWLKLLRAWLRTKAIMRSAYAVECAGLLQIIIARCKAVAGVKKVRILSSAKLTVPVTIGSLNPRVIVPEELLREADADILTSAIGHELFHISRRDYLLNLIYEFIYLPLSFHPAAALVGRRIRQTRELSCDEMVTEKLLKAEIYARSLVRLADSAVALGRSTTTITVGIADADILEERIMTILRRPKISVCRKNFLLITAALVFAVPCAAAAPFSLLVGITTQADASVLPKTTVQESQSRDLEKEKARYFYERAVQVLKRASEERLRAERQAQNTPVTPQQGETQEARQQEERRKREAQEREERVKEDVLQQMKEKMEREAKEYREKIKMDGNFEMFEKMRMGVVKMQAELAKKATLPMQHAIQIASNQQPGTVIACELKSYKGEVYYHARILSEEDGDSIVHHIFISALDGRVVKVEKEKR